MELIALFATMLLLSIAMPTLAIDRHSGQDRYDGGGDQRVVGKMAPRWLLWPGRYLCRCLVGALGLCHTAPTANEDR